MNFYSVVKKGFLVVSVLLCVFSINIGTARGEDIGVLFVTHGGMDTNDKPQYMWDVSVHQFSYDQNHSVYKLVIWNPPMWPLVLDPTFTEWAQRFIRMYDFEYERIGGTDPFHSITDQQIADMETVLNANSYGINFYVDWAGYMAGGRPEHYAYPRFLYYGPDGPGVGSNCTYCGEGEKEDVVLAFDVGTSAFTVDVTLTGQTSGATAVIDEVTVNSGTWVGGDAAGFLALSNVSGSFEDDELIIDDGTIPGSATADGTTTWPDCDPDRYNIDGPVERLLNQGVSRIIAIDWTMGGPRFSKTYDVVEMTTRALDDWNDAHGTSIPLLWVNDYSNLMERSYPLEPEGWTRCLKTPTLDSHVLLNGSPNPVASDPMVVTLHVEAIEAAFSGSVSDADTGVMLFNHALHDYNEPFDPKINDTLIINKAIKAELLSRHPTMNPANILGSFGGIQEVNPENDLEERSREMMGESYGHAWLYESNKVLPGDEWGYRYWDALEYLMDQGVQHIVISFPQVVTDSCLNMVEIYNQLAGRMIGYKNWAKWGTGDYARYPGVGHPFADYWGIWVNTDCGVWELNYDNGTSAFTTGARLTGQTSGATGVIKWFSGEVTSGTLTLKEVSGTFLDNETIKDNRNPQGSALANGTATQTISTNCCFEMGGCADDPLPRPYPPLRQTPLSEMMSDLDPTLCFDMSEYGHLGYDPGTGAPDPDNPVQDQYTGTWEIYIPPNDDSRVGTMLAEHVINAAINPMVYITTIGEIQGTDLGVSVTFKAHVVSGTPAYSYAWSIKEEGDPGWTAVGSDSATWIWTPGSGDEGVYNVRCIVTDSLTRTGEVVWEEFFVPDADGDGIVNSEDNCWEVSNLDQLDSNENCPEPPYGSDPECGDACENFCQSDFDNDGNVYPSDLSVFLGEYGRTDCLTTPPPCEADFDDDGNVYPSDLSVFLGEYGRTDCLP